MVHNLDDSIDITFRHIVEMYADQYTYCLSDLGIGPSCKIPRKCFLSMLWYSQRIYFDLAFDGVSHRRSTNMGLTACNQKYPVLAHRIRLNLNRKRNVTLVQDMFTSLIND